MTAPASPTTVASNPSNTVAASQVAVMWAESRWPSRDPGGGRGRG